MWAAGERNITEIAKKVGFSYSAAWYAVKLRSRPLAGEPAEPTLDDRRLASRLTQIEDMRDRADAIALELAKARSR